MAVMLRDLRSLILLAGMTLLGLPLAAQSDDHLPEVKTNARYSETQGCVEPREEMRKNHMEYILHQRDETMHQGIRTRQYALEECINCHAVPDESGEVARIDNPEHFCAGCHTYAAVKIDCFQCHADRPVKQTAFHPLGGKTFHHTENSVDTPVSSDTLGVLAAEGKL
ncbi:MAG: hypothetical protein LOY58_13650 [Gammaproteobacteria bacterium]|jgi:hypothetical protein|nr:hypothetical protein [Gammaproteobacteria bacterium]